jgi:hypothetical protein
MLRRILIDILLAVGIIGGWTGKGACEEEVSRGQVDVRGNMQMGKR